MKNRTIIFFTKPEKLKVVFQTRKLKFFLDSKNLIKIGVDNCDACFIYLVHDESNINFDALTKNTRGVYICHNETNPILKQELDNKGFLKFKDHHVPKGSTISNGYYSWLDDIGIDTLREGKYISKVQFDTFWNRCLDSSELKEVLNLLHTIYSGNLITKDFINKYADRLIEISKKDIDEGTKRFINDVRKENYKYDDSQQHLLSSLRDLLLTNII